MSRRGLLGAAAACACLAAVAALAAGVVNVQVRDGQLRSAPSFLGRIVGQVGYGQAVTVAESQGDWSRVAAGSVSGWIHASALTTADLGLQSGSGGAPSSVTEKEMALAGKGFNAQVEKQYRSSHGGDFASVDRMERQGVQTERLVAFLRQGGVGPAGGGQ